MIYSFKKIIKSTILDYLNYSAKKNYLNYYKKVIDNNPIILTQKLQHKQDWLSKWKKYDKNISTKAYDVFSYYIGEDINIVPMELCVNMIEPILTPSKYAEFYGDKNSLGKIIPKNYFPTVFLRNIRGSYYGENYQHYSYDTIDTIIDKIPHEKIILKPSLLDSGLGIDIFKRNNGKFYNGKEYLTKQYLDKYYKQDYLIQECLHQSSFTAQFNSSSVNSLRLATYRDIKGVVHPLKAVFKIGAKGAVVDNAHSGGVACGVNAKGKLGKYVSDMYGNKQTSYNGIDFENNEFIIPNYQEIQSFAVSVSESVLHHDLVALDIALDQNNKPALLEINVQGFAGWIFQILSGSIFGDYTDEVMKRCYDEIHQISPKIIVSE